jgi:hypothetical protein
MMSFLAYITGFFMNFELLPIWTIKISSPLFSILSLAAILVGSRDQRTQFWKGAIQESFQQNLVDIGSVVSEEKIFFKFHPPFFLFLTWWSSWLEVEITGHNFGREPPKDHSIKIWLQLAQWFLRRRLKCEMLTNGRRKKSDGNSSR